MTLLTVCYVINIGEELIQLINTCNKECPVIKKRYSSIRKAVLKALREDYIFTKCIIPYPVVFFPDKDVAATSFHLNILEVAAEMLLKFQPADIALLPNILRNENGSRIYSDPSSALVYESMYDSIKIRLGRSDVYPLCIMVSGDEVQLNKKGSMGCKPWYISIGNVRGALHTSGRNIECIGYSPDWIDTKVSLHIIDVFIKYFLKE